MTATILDNATEQKRKNMAIRDRIEKQLQEEQTKLFDEYNVSFAFGPEQSDEYVKSQRDLGYEGAFVALGSGMVARKDNYKEFLNKLAELHKDYKTQKRNAWSMDELIESELIDHECYYTGNYLECNMVDAVRSFFPEATDYDFKRVYDKTYNKHQSF